MSQVTLYMYANCSSCRNAEQILRASNVELETREFFKDRFTTVELRTLFQHIGTTPQAMLSRRSIPFRELGLATKDLGDEQLLDLMTDHPALIRRPIIITPDGSQIGFNRASVEQLAKEYGRR
jgi:arsenate reductase